MKFEPSQTIDTEGPILGICWSPETPAVLIAHSDTFLKKWDFQNNNLAKLGRHDQPVKDIYSFCLKGSVYVVSGGWDAKVKFWTWSDPNTLKQIGETYVAKPVHYMSGEYPLLVTAHSE